MTKKTERPRASSPVTMSASNLRLYLIAMLAAAYFMAYWLLGIRAPAKPSEARAAIEPILQATAGHGTAVWIHDLPLAERPAVNLPAGFHVADLTSAPAMPVMTTRAVPVAVRVSSVRARSIRTRSS